MRLAALLQEIGLSLSNPCLQDPESTFLGKRSLKRPPEAEFQIATLLLLVIFVEEHG